MGRFLMMLSMLSVSVFAGYTYTYTTGMDFGDLSLNGSESILVDGGEGHHLNLLYYSTATINDTSPLISEGNGGIWQIMMGSYSKITIKDGAIHRLSIGSYATAQINGGQIDQIWSYYASPDPSRIIVTCNPGYQLTYTGSFVTAISGTWHDGSAFNIQLVNPSGNSSVFANMTIIPEPTTIMLLGLGGLAFFRRR